MEPVARRCRRDGKNCDCCCGNRFRDGLFDRKTSNCLESAFDPKLTLANHCDTGVLSDKLRADTDGALRELVTPRGPAGLDRFNKWSDLPAHRAAQPLIEAERKRVETNPYWLGKLTEITRDPRVRDEVLTELDSIRGVTVDEVQALARKYIAAHEPLIAISKAATGNSTSTTAAPNTRH